MFERIRNHVIICKNWFPNKMPLYYFSSRPGVLITTANMWTSGGYGDVWGDFHYLYMPAEVKVYIIQNDTVLSSVSLTMVKFSDIKNNLVTVFRSLCNKTKNGKI